MSAEGMLPVFWIDGYKAGHVRQYPPGTSFVYSNFTPRKCRIPGETHMVFFGLQAALKRLVDAFKRDFFTVPREIVVAEYADFMSGYLGANAGDAEHIGQLHDYGRLPLTVKALPEGTLVPLGTPCFTLYNSDPRFSWVTNYLETYLSAQVWKPCTSATTALRFRNLFERFAAETGAAAGFVPYQGHDFSLRGMSGIDDIAAGAGHLLYFRGTDTIPSIKFIQKNYPSDLSVGEIGCSVAATEHSVMCAGGQENELATIKRLLTEVYPSGIVSVVSDTWDLFDLLANKLPMIRDEIMARDGKLVIRPDSGTPHLIVNGDPDSDCPLERAGALRLLCELFGGTKNAAGYTELDPHVGLIYGDGIDHHEASRILNGMASNGFASSNVVLGLGSYTYQYVTRDTYGTVCKATATIADGETKALSKTPKTGAWKNSHKGFLRVNDDLSVTQDVTWEEQEQGLLYPVMIDGLLRPLMGFDQVRAIAEKSIEQPALDPA